ncbi:MAG TPA: DUF4258 domain-containing protein [Gammaproteobacteria bacterium]|nr:DUF4258 domain-containing protein [Gammaproteobacteria bacterium]
MQLEWSFAKNTQLKQERGLCFEDVEQALSGDGFVDDLPHLNAEQYPNQRLLIVLIDHYPCVVPYIRDGNKLFLKTIYPNQKLKSLFLERNDDE